MLLCYAMPCPAMQLQSVWEPCLGEMCLTPQGLPMLALHGRCLTGVYLLGTDACLPRVQSTDYSHHIGISAAHTGSKVYNGTTSSPNAK